MRLPSRALVRAGIAVAALGGSTLLFSSGASAAPADGPVPGVTLPPVTLPPVTIPPIPVPLPTVPATPPPTTTPTKPAVPATPTLPPVTVPAPPAGSLPTVPELPGGSTPTLPPEVTIPDVPGVDVELCAELELAEQPLVDTCVKDTGATATTAPAPPAKPAKATGRASGTEKRATVDAAASSGGSSGGSSTGGGTLARTGSDLGTPVAIGAGLAALGGLALAASRMLPRLLGRMFIQ